MKYARRGWEGAHLGRVPPPGPADSAQGKWTDPEGVPVRYPRR